MANDSILDISKILDEYSIDVQDGIMKAAQDVAKKGVAELKNSSPKRTGKYRKGWRVKTIKGNSSINCIIHNATDYQLTHLLEKPHALRNGRLSVPKIHIAPVEKECISEFENEVQEIIRNG